jgi:hypothetical protein
LCGRVAEFEYINMDTCIERALKVAARINEETAPELERQGELAAARE